MQKWLLLLFLFAAYSSSAQRGMLFVKKKGFKKVASFAEGSPIIFQTKDGGISEGYISLIRNDSIYVNGLAYHKNYISRIILRKKNHQLKSDLLYTTAGVVICTAGMTLAKWTTPENAFVSSAAIGYGNLLIANLWMFSRKQYLLGKRFSLQTLDLHFDTKSF